MEDVKFTGRIISSDVGCEASIIVPIGDYRIMILSDDNCGDGKGQILRSELYVYHKDSKPSDNINEKVFGEKTFVANSETLFDAIMHCQRILRRSI